MSVCEGMMRFRDIVGVAVVLTACAGPPAGGQGVAVARPNVYEIAPEQVAMAQDPGFIEVSGSGSVSVEPDEAAVSFAMETRATAANDAASANATAMDRVIGSLRAAEFPGLEIETFGYSLRPEYAVSGPQRTREIVAYTALNNIRTTITDVEAVGRLIDSAISAGANRVAGISFMASDTEAARSEALALAVENARAQAEVIATSLGHRLGAPLEVRGGSQRPVPVMARGAVLMEAQAAPTPIEAGDQTVTASVTIRFALGPELGG